MHAQAIDPVLSERQFGPGDGVFLLEASHYAYLAARANPSFRDCRAIPLTIDALDSVLNAGHASVLTAFDLVDIAEMRGHYQLALEKGGSWLREMRHEFKINDVDLAQIDATSQILLFRLILYFDSIAGKLIERAKDIETFFLLQATPPEPLEMDFNSDVIAAVLRYACERQGRRVRVIESSEPVTNAPPPYNRRPFVEPWIPPFRLPALLPDQPHPRIGFLPSTVPEGMVIIRDVRGLNGELLLFYATRPVSAPRMGDPEPMLPLEVAWSDEVGGKLTEIRDSLAERRALSSLPDCIIGNPHLDFQFDFILRERWLNYANFINRATRFVLETPLDILIIPEHFIFEAAVLRDLYRRQGTKILLAPEGCGSVPPHLSGAEPSDLSMQWSRIGSLPLVRDRQAAAVYVTGKPLIGSRPTAEAEQRFEIAKARKGDKKLVVFVTNNLEVGWMPLLNYVRHAEAVKAVSQVPPHLRERVRFAMRRKAPTGSNSDAIYQQFFGMEPETVTFLDGLTFTQSIELADCVLGINTATNGYYEVFEAGKPLVHLQTTEVLLQQPDLPAAVIRQTDSPEAAWAEIEKALFDENYRQAVLTLQSSFAAEDRQPAFAGMSSPIQRLLHHLLSSPAEP